MCEEVALRGLAEPNWPSRDGRDTLGGTNEGRTRHTERGTGTSGAGGLLHLGSNYDCCCFASSSNLLMIMFDRVGSGQTHRAQEACYHLLLAFGFSVFFLEELMGQA